jgi:muconolactone delta-isomerase
MDNLAVDDRPTFIVQNITPFYHVCSDINMTWGPREVKDLTWEDPMIIKRSSNLKNSLREGTLRQLNEAEYEKTIKLQYEKERKQLMREQKNKNEYRNLKVDDKEFAADTFDLMASRKKNDTIDITGTANHPMSYVTAFEIAQNIATERGDLLTAEEFSTMVESNPNIVPALLSSARQAEAEKPSKPAYYAAPMGEGNTTSAGVVKTSMKTLNREAMILPDSGELEMKASYIMDSIGYDESDAAYHQDSIDLDIDMADDDSDFAEEIIIEED